MLEPIPSLYGTNTQYCPLQLVIWDDVKQKAVITLEFRTSVLGVRLSKSRIVVALLNSIHIFAFSNPPQKLSVFETSDNPMGLACLGSKLIAFPGRSPGQVQLVELETGNVSIIPAHSTPLRAMDLSPDGEVLATASEAVSTPCSYKDYPRLVAYSFHFTGHADTCVLYKQLHQDGRVTAGSRSCGDILTSYLPFQQSISRDIGQIYTSCL